MARALSQWQPARQWTNPPEWHSFPLGALVTLPRTGKKTCMEYDPSQLPADPREERIRSVLIVGGGSSGWMTAAYLARALSRDVDIRLVESDNIGVIGVGEATIPPIKSFNRFIQLDEREFMSEAHGTFKLGIDFENWGWQGSHYLHPFGRVIREIDAVIRLNHWWLAGRRGGTADYPAWEDMFLAKGAARANRFAIPPNTPQSPLSTMVYAYHFDAVLYGRYLRRLAEGRRVRRIEGRIVDVDRDGESGNVKAVTLADGQRLEADFFIDCSGFRSLLLGDAMEEPFDDWSHWIPSDRALALRSEPTADGPEPYTKSIAHEVGWQWRIPLQGRIGNGHVYASAFSSDEDAERRLMETLDTKPIGDPRLIKFTTGRRHRGWVGNVVGIGLSAGFLEPLESTSLHLVQSALERLVYFFPTRHIDPRLRDHFNAHLENEWTNVRDFIIAHYHVTTRTDSDFWNYVRTMSVPDSLAETLELWRERALFDLPSDHLFQLGSWCSVLLGQGLLPEGVHALADRAPIDYISTEIHKIAGEVEQVVRQMPSHRQFLERHCPARSLEPSE